jgi:hypothetical protein
LRAFVTCTRTRSSTSNGQTLSHTILSYRDRNTKRLLSSVLRFLIKSDKYQENIPKSGAQSDQNQANPNLGPRQVKKWGFFLYKLLYREHLPSHFGKNAPKILQILQNDVNDYYNSRYDLSMTSIKQCCTKDLFLTLTFTIMVKDESIENEALVFELKVFTFDWNPIVFWLFLTKGHFPELRLRKS